MLVEVWWDIALDPLRLISIVPYGSMIRGSNLIDVSSVEMIGYRGFPVAIEGDSSWFVPHPAVAHYTLTSVAISANLSMSVGPNLSPVGGVKVVTGGWLIVAVEWHRTINLVLVDVALHSLGSVSILSNMTICCGSYFVAVCRVEMVRDRSVPVAVEWSFGIRIGIVSQPCTLQGKDEEE